MINIRAGRLTTAEAAARLGVKPATLYAYVSRGLLHSERGSGGSTFDAQEWARLVDSSRRATAGGSGRLAFATALTLIDDGMLYYRGEAATELARDRTFEEVA